MKTRLISLVLAALLLAAIPASAMKANIAVPAPVSFDAARRKVPGQKMPTENPQAAQPISPAAGLFVSVASR